MTDIALQFHATPSENYEFAVNMADKYSVILYVTLFPPQQTVRMGDKGSHIEDLVNWKSVCIVFVRPESALAKVFPYPPELPECLMLWIGLVHGQTLGESALTYRGYHADDYKLWNRIATDFKKIAPTGGVFWGKEGITPLRPDKSHRVTNGARTFARAGNTLVDLSGRPFTIENG